MREGMAGGGSRRGVRRASRTVLVGGLLAALVPGAWGAGGGETEASGPPSPESCVRAPTARCVIRLSLAAVDEVAGAASRAEALARIAEAQAGAGEAGEARDSLARALAAAERVDAAAYAGDPWIKTSAEEVAFGEQARVLSLIARVQADAGDPGGARETFTRAVAAAHGIETGHVRAAALVEVAKMQLAAGAPAEARRTLARADLAGNAWSLLDLPELVQAQAEAGDVAGALATARTLPGDESTGKRVQALAHVAAVQAATGDEPGALATAGAIGSQHYRMGAMRHIGAARAERGDVAGAWAAVREIQDEIWHNPRLRDDTDGRGVTLAQAAIIGAIAHAHVARGELEEASAAIRAEEMEDDFTYLEVRAAVAKARVAAGPLDAARGWVDALCEVAEPDAYGRCAEALADLAAALSAAGRADASREVALRALDVAGRAVYDSDRVEAFVAAYAALMRAGEAEAARRAFTAALAAAEGVYGRAEELLRLGEAAARAGDTASAARLAASGGVDVRTLVLAGLAGRRAGDAAVARALLSPAVATATAHETAGLRAETLAAIALALATGRWPAAERYPGHFQ